jgi:hypothetical protein
LVSAFFITYCPVEDNLTLVGYLFIYIDYKELVYFSFAYRDASIIGSVLLFGCSTKLFNWTYFGYLFIDFDDVDGAWELNEFTEEEFEARLVAIFDFDG